jgi:hypothetical protein
MLLEQDWESLFLAEISHAEVARSQGLEGMARVCARRAVGIVLGEYFRRNQIPVDSPSAYDRLRFLQNMPNMPDDLLTRVQHFLVRVTPDYRLPIEADLIAEAQQIRRMLLGNE